MSGFYSGQAPAGGEGQPYQQSAHQPFQQTGAPMQQNPHEPYQQQGQTGFQQPTHGTNFPPPPPPPSHQQQQYQPTAGQSTSTAPGAFSEQQAPPLPVRPTGEQQYTYQPPQQDNRTTTCPRCSYENHPAMDQCEMCEAPLNSSGVPQAPSFAPPPGSQGFGNTQNAGNFAPPPQRMQQTWADDDLNNPLHYTRDPEKLVAYIIPLPMPNLKTAPVEGVTRRFLIYTPPPPPLFKPQLAPGEKENKVHLAQRKWQEQVRTAKTSNEKVSSFKGIHHRMVKGADKAIGLTTSSNLDFLGRVSPGQSPGGSRPSTPERRHADDGVNEGHETKKTVGVNEIVFLYPASMGTDEAALREEFINTLMRTKSKAEKDSVIATGLVPVGFGIDFMLVVVGGLGEIATAWAFKSIMGAKTARSMTKRLSSASNDPNAQLKLTFRPSNRLEPMRNYVTAECHKVDSQMFPGFQTPPTESAIIESIGWSPSQTGGETKNWEDEQWELTEVKEDWRITMHKGAKEWKKYCAGYEKDFIKEQEKQAKAAQQQQQQQKK